MTFCVCFGFCPPPPFICSSKKSSPFGKLSSLGRIATFCVIDFFLLLVSVDKLCKHKISTHHVLVWKHASIAYLHGFSHYVKSLSSHPTSLFESTTWIANVSMVTRPKLPLGLCSSTNQDGDRCRVNIYADHVLWTLGRSLTEKYKHAARLHLTCVQ